MIAGSALAPGVPDLRVVDCPRSIAGWQLKIHSRRAPQPHHQPHRSHKQKRRRIESRRRARKRHRSHRVPQNREQGVAKPVKKHDDRIRPTPAAAIRASPAPPPESGRTAARKPRPSPASHSRNSNVGMGNQFQRSRRMVTVGLYTARKPVVASSRMCSANATHSANHALPKPDAESAGVLAS